MRYLATLLITLTATAAIQAGAPEVEHYSANPDMQLPFSDAVRVGHMLYLSGKIGNIPGTRNLAAGGIAGETRQTLENIKASLEKHGSSLGEVVKCTVFLADIAEWAAMNEVYVEYFPEDHFRVVIGQRDGIPQKPDPVGAREIAQQLSLPTDRFLLLGDTAVDMQTARAAGMYPVGALWGFRPLEELKAGGAETVIRQPADLLDVLGVG